MSIHEKIKEKYIFYFALYGNSKVLAFTQHSFRMLLRKGSLAERKQLLNSGDVYAVDKNMNNIFIGSWGECNDYIAREKELKSIQKEMLETLNKSKQEN